MRLQVLKERMQGLLHPSDAVNECWGFTSKLDDEGAKEGVRKEHECAGERFIGALKKGDVRARRVRNRL
jgi:hypothetical protein